MIPVLLLLIFSWYSSIWFFNLTVFFGFRHVFGKPNITRFYFFSLSIFIFNNILYTLMYTITKIPEFILSSILCYLLSSFLLFLFSFFVTFEFFSLFLPFAILESIYSIANILAVTFYILVFILNMSNTKTIQYVYTFPEQHRDTKLL